MAGQIDGLDILEELGAKTALLDRAVSELKSRGRAFAGAERDYRLALAKKILAARQDGIPVTIISDVCRGDGEIAMLRFQRDVAEVAYKAAQEAINNYKLQIRILDAQAAREWGIAR